MTDDPVIFMEHVRFSYDSTPVLEDVNLAIAEKELTWIVGPNGGGKTTLIKLILGLLHPSKGIIRVFGGTPESARSRIGYMPQYTRFDPRFPISAREVVLMGRLGSGFKFGRFGRNDLRAAEEALEMVRLAEVRDRMFSDLSGGQLRRLLIARALACDPELLILDEPTANLDLLVARELYDLLQELGERMTVVMVSHDPAFVSEHVRQVVCVRQSVTTHPTARVDSAFMSEIYGGELRMVRHDRHLEDEGDSHD